MVQKKFTDGNRRIVLSVKSESEVIMDHITIENSNYKVKINLGGFELGSGNLEYLIKEIALANWNWYNFDVGEKLYYLDGSDSITCISVDNVNGIIVFGK